MSTELFMQLKGTNDHLLLVIRGFLCHNFFCSLKLSLVNMGFPYYTLLNGGVAALCCKLPEFEKHPPLQKKTMGNKNLCCPNQCIVAETRTEIPC